MKPTTDDRVNSDSIAECIQSREGLTFTQSQRIVKLVFEQIVLQLLIGKMVDILGFGRFYAQYVQARKGSHPKTKEPIYVAPAVKVSFSVSSSLKKLLNTRTEEFKVYDERREGFYTAKKEKQAASRQEITD